MSPYLLDVNVLLALCDPLHVHHEAAHRWFDRTGRVAWATCPITENGLVRVLSHPSYPNRAGDAPAALAMLRQLCALEGHRFWPADISLRDVLVSGAVVTHGQLADVFLLGLAAKWRGRLATFDGRIPTSAVADGASALALIPA